MLELTVPWEERIEEANERKRAKYQELVEECRERGWRTFYEPIEVGCRGFAGRSLAKSSVVWVLQGGQEEGHSIRAKPQRRPLGGFGLRGLIRGLLLGRKSGLDQPWLGHLGEGVCVRDPKHPMIPGYITEDAFQCIHEMFLHSMIIMKHN